MRASSGSAWSRPLTLARKDLVLELRTRELANAGVVMALAVLLVGGVSLSTLPSRVEVASGVLWTALAFASLVLVGRGFAGEFERGTITLLLLLPVERAALYLGKVASTFAVALALGLLTLGAFVLLFQYPLGAEQAGFLLVLVLGVSGFVVSGSAISAIAAQARTREALLPVLLIPLVLPVILAAVPASVHALAGDPVATYASELTFMLGYDVVFLAASALLFDAVVEG